MGNENVIEEAANARINFEEINIDSSAAHHWSLASQQGSENHNMLYLVFTYRKSLAGDSEGGEYLYY